MRDRNVEISVEALTALLGAGRELVRQADLANGAGLAGLSAGARAELAAAVDAAERALRRRKRAGGLGGRYAAPDGPCADGHDAGDGPRSLSRDLPLAERPPMLRLVPDRRPRWDVC